MQPADPDTLASMLALVGGRSAVASTATSILRTENLTVAYGGGTPGEEAVRNVSLTVGPKEVLGIVGESGCGKSTLAQVVTGYRPEGSRVSNGSVTFKGRPLLDLPERDLADIWGREIGVVHQNPLAALTPTMRVGDQIAEAIARHRELSWSAAKAEALRAIAAVEIPRPEAIYGRYPHELSGGQRQRISIAIALSLRPELLVLDEPTTALDVTTEATVLDLLRTVRSQLGVAMIFISHNLAVVASLADRIAVMHSGEVVEIGDAETLFRQPRHPYTRALVDCLPRRGETKRTTRLEGGEAGPSIDPRSMKGCVYRLRCPRLLPGCESKPLLRPIPGGALRCINPVPLEDASARTARPATATWPRDEVAVSASRVSKAFKLGPGRRETMALADVTVRGRAAEVVGIVGESGSGKTTLLRCLAGLSAASAGEFEIFGKRLHADIRHRTRPQLKSVQMVFQDPSGTLNPAVTVGENLVRHVRALQRCGRTEALAQVRRIVHSARLTDAHLARRPAELSGGEKQRIAISRAFAAEPAIVLCDEPLTALDVSIQATVLQLLLDLQGQHDTTLVFVSHDIAVVKYISDTIVVMYGGEVLEEGPAASFDRLPLHPYTEALFSAVPSLTEDAAVRVRLGSQSAAGSEGCVFASRCPRVIGAVCFETRPPPQAVLDRTYRCHLAPPVLAELQTA